MVKSSWGVKRTCPCGNGVRFYDLNKKEIECPSCGESINVEHLSVSTLENNLRKKPHTKVLEEPKISNENNKDKDTVIEIDSDDDPKTEVKEIIGDKLKDKDKEKE